MVRVSLVCFPSPFVGLLVFLLINTFTYTKTKKQLRNNNYVINFNQIIDPYIQKWKYMYDSIRSNVNGKCRKRIRVVRESFTYYSRLGSYRLSSWVWVRCLLDSMSLWAYSKLLEKSYQISNCQFTSLSPAQINNSYLYLKLKLATLELFEFASCI